ncbi:MAG TPA: GNAT family N-acetyltransferase [Steroidobacteraceae bacterium]|nr:GNAT family N-acetyltransferase [Steroidobacteraceae bacterium]
MISIRPAAPQEVPLVLSFIRELARYERLEHALVATEADLTRTLFGARPYAHALFACLDGTPVGFAVYFYNYSTFMGRPGLYLEDLYVRPAARGLGIGRRVLVHLAQLALEQDCRRLEWAVLDWNEPAIGFYKRLGATANDEWTGYRLAGDALARLAYSAA